MCYLGRDELEQQPRACMSRAMAPSEVARALLAHPSEVLVSSRAPVGADRALLAHRAGGAARALLAHLSELLVPSEVLVSSRAPVGGAGALLAHPSKTRTSSCPHHAIVDADFIEGRTRKF